YGKNRNTVIEWSEGTSNVTFKGSWNSSEVCNNMMQYDIVVVPSKYDGWNLLPNEALHAGIGVIVTDEAVSDELISASQAGIVVKSNNPKALAKAMQFAVDNPNEVEIWKKKADNYIDKISSQTVGNYFIDILDYVFYNTSREKPKCPWI